MKNSKITLMKLAFLASFMSLGFNAKAEGTKEMSPSSDNLSALWIAPSIKTGPYLNSAFEQRIFFNIKNTGERLYYGFKWSDYATNTLFYSTNNNSTNKIFIVIYGPDGQVVESATQLTRVDDNSNGYISTYQKAVNGPNIFGTTNGYVPLTFTPTQTGEYSIVLFRGANANNQANDGSWARADYFDFTVANPSLQEKYTGRVYSHKWGLVAVNKEHTESTPSNSVSPSVYSYSFDQTVVKLGFGDGFQPYGYEIVVNNHGINPNEDWLTSRKSKNTNLAIVDTNNYKLFLNNPDRTLYPVAEFTAEPKFSAVPITGCQSGGYELNFDLPEEGDASIVIDLNGTVGYQKGTKDRLLEVPNAARGKNTIIWDGKDGEGNYVSEGAVMHLEVTYKRGRFNLPLFDPEINKGGITLETIAPLQSPTNRLYWDDTELTAWGNCSTNNPNNDNNTTSGGIDNSINGTISPAHAWNGNGNPNQTIPAPSVGNNDGNTRQCDDFGNARIINTWGWALEHKTAPSTMVFGCFTVSGTVYHDVNGVTDNFVNGTPTNLTNALYVYLVGYDSVVIDKVPVQNNGKFTLNDVKGYAFKIVVSSENLVAGDTLKTANLPSGWVHAATQVGTVAGENVNANSNGILEYTVTGNANNLRFGIQKAPTVDTTVTSAIINPGGNNFVAVNNSGFVADDSDGTVQKVVIPNLPANVESIKINDNTYTASNWPVGGVELTVNNNNVTDDISFDPIDGESTVNIEYYAVDNANAKSILGSYQIPVELATISGNVYNDANGLTDGKVNGTPTDLNGASIYLVNANDNTPVAFTTIATDGSYEFTNLNQGAYRVVVDIYSVPENSYVPEGSNWMHVSEGVDKDVKDKDSTNGTLAITITTKSVSKADFGLNMSPVADAYLKTIVPQNAGDKFTFGNTTLPSPSGEDLEDGALGKGNTVQIVALPENTILYYNDEAVKANDIIQNFDPELLEIEIPGAALNSGLTNFTYRFIDAAETPSTSNATYEINWNTQPFSLLFGDLKAQLQNGKTKLEWETHLTPGTDAHYTIERSLDGFNWENIDELQVKVTSVANTYWDANPVAGRNYYKIKLSLIDGTSYYSEIKSVSFQSGLAEVYAYPNPVNGWVAVSGVEVSDIEKIQVSTVTGTIVDVEINANQANLSSLPAGIYQLIISVKNQGSIILKVTKN